MKQDKIAEPGFYVQLYKWKGKTCFELSAWVREDYKTFWTRSGEKTWYSLMWTHGPRKNWQKKTESNTKQDCEFWWERCETIEDLRSKVDNIKQSTATNEDKIPDVLGA